MGIGLGSTAALLMVDTGLNLKLQALVVWMLDLYQRLILAGMVPLW